MSLKKICEQEELDKLAKGDAVDFFPEPKKNRPWQDPLIFYGREFFQVGFLARAVNGDSIYTISINRDNLLPTKSGALEIEKDTIVRYEEIDELDPMYDEYMEIIKISAPKE